MNESIKDFVSTFKKPKQPKPIKTVADEIKRLNKNEKPMTTSLYKEEKMKVKIKKLHANSILPKYAKPGDAGMDLTVTKMETLDNYHVKYYFGIAIEIPNGYVGLIFPRSSIYKQGQLLSNSVGVVDSGYRGEICAVFTHVKNNSRQIIKNY